MRARPRRRRWRRGGRRTARVDADDARRASGGRGRRSSASDREELERLRRPRRAVARSTRRRGSGCSTSSPAPTGLTRRRVDVLAPRRHPGAVRAAAGRRARRRARRSRRRPIGSSPRRASCRCSRRERRSGEAFRRRDGRLLPVERRASCATRRRSCSRSSSGSSSAVARAHGRGRRRRRRERGRAARSRRGRRCRASSGAMVERLCLDGDGVAVVVGKAGTGKTFALGAAREAWQAAGHPGARAWRSRGAPRASCEHGAGIASTSVAALLGDLAARGRPRCRSGACSSSTRPAWSRRGSSPSSLDARRARSTASSCSSATTASCPRSRPAARSAASCSAASRSSCTENRRQVARVGARGARPAPRRPSRARRSRCYQAHDRVTVEATAERRARAARRRLVGRRRPRRGGDDRPPPRRRRRPQRPRPRAHARGRRARRRRARDCPAARSRSAIASSSSATTSASGSSTATAAASSPSIATRGAHARAARGAAGRARRATSSTSATVARRPDAAARLRDHRPRRAGPDRRPRLRARRRRRSTASWATPRSAAAARATTSTSPREPRRRARGVRARRPAPRDPIDALTAAPSRQRRAALAIDSGSRLAPRARAAHRERAPLSATQAARGGRSTPRRLVSPASPASRTPERRTRAATRLEPAAGWTLERERRLAAFVEQELQTARPVARRRPTRERGLDRDLGDRTDGDRSPIAVGGLTDELIRDSNPPTSTPSPSACSRSCRTSSPKRPCGYVDAGTLAKALGVDRSWVYAHAAGAARHSPRRRARPAALRPRPSSAALLADGTGRAADADAAQTAHEGDATRAASCCRSIPRLGATDMPPEPTGQFAVEDLADGTRAFRLRFRALGKRQREVLHERAGLRVRLRRRLGRARGARRARQRPRPRARGRLGAADAARRPRPPRRRRSPTFHEYASAWLRAKVDGVLGDKPIDANTESDYRWRLSRHLLPFFATYRLDEIDRELCLAFKARKLQEARELREAIAAGADLRDRHGRRQRPLSAVLDPQADRHARRDPRRRDRGRAASTATPPAASGCASACPSRRARSSRWTSSPR